MVRYLYQPSAIVTRHLARRRSQLGLEGADGLQRSDYVSVNVRWGDKVHTEAHSISPHTYHTHATHLLARTNATAIYLATASPAAVDAMRGEHRSSGIPGVLLIVPVEEARVLDNTIVKHNQVD